MKRIIIALTACLTVCSPVSAFGQNEASTNDSKMITVGGKKISATKLRETIRKVQLKKTGGMIREKGSAKRKFVILNAQKRVSSGSFKSVTDTIDKWLLMQTSVKNIPNEKINISNIKAKIKSFGGVVGVGIFDDPSLPGFLAAPE